MGPTQGQQPKGQQSMGQHSRGQSQSRQQRGQQSGGRQSGSQQSGTHQARGQQSPGQQSRQSMPRSTQQRQQSGQQSTQGPPIQQSQQPQTQTQQQPPRSQPGQSQFQQPGMQGSMQGMQAGPGLQTGQMQRSGGGQSTGMPSGTELLEPMTVEEAVRDEVFTADRDTPVEEIVQQMDEMNVGSAVVEEDGTPIGIITDRSIAMSLTEEPDVVEQTAEDFIDGEVVSAMEGTTLSEVLEKMSEEQIRRIPVVDESGELEGIVTLDDLLVLLESKFSTVTDTIQGQFPDI